MPTNFYMFFVTALIPLVVGFIYYNPKVFGGQWMKINGFTEQTLREKGNPAVIFGVCYLLACMLSLALSFIVIHQGGAVSAAMSPDGTWSPEAIADINAYMAKYGSNFRTFGHGAVHGFIAALFIALPIIATNALFERRGGKYIFIHWGYWAVTLVLMGGVLCQTLVFAPMS